jgi:short-subunit dehydrogenase
MTFSIFGAVTVLTGAASGIGAALAVQLAAKGAKLALVDRNAAGLETVAEQARAAGATVTTHVLDIADAAAIATLPAAVEEAHGGAAVLINNAGVALAGTFEQASLEDFEWLMNINFWGAVRLTHAFLPLLRRAPAAQIVLTSSVFGLIGPPGQTAYAASKFALRGFGESLRHELEATNIGVTLIHPGGIATNIAQDSRIGKNVDPIEARAGIVQFQKMLKTSPQTAAARIVAGLEKREKRILIGADAYQIDFLQRLLPVRYWGLIGRSARKLSTLTQARS